MEEQNFNTVTITEEKVIKNPVFLLFAEFLGYTSPIVEWAEEMCKGKKLDKFKTKFIDIEAKCIFNKILEENITKEDLRGWYDEMYELIFEKYDKGLQISDDLPF